MEKGEVSQEDAEAKLIELRQKMFGAKEAGEDTATEGRRVYEEAVKRLKGEVEKGRMTAAEAEQGLAELRRGIFGGEDPAGGSERKDPRRDS